MRLHLGLLLVTVLACGGGGGDPYDDGGPTGPPGNTPNNPPPSSTPSSSAIVEMRRSGDGYGGEVHSFTPNRVTITRGGTVTWSNGSGFAHNVTFAGSGGPQDIIDFTAGSRDRTFSATGTFAYSCTNHPGMSGEVVVP